MPERFGVVQEVGSAQADTVYALSTPQGISGIAVVRVSGPHAGQALQELIGTGLPEARRASCAAIRYPGTEDVIDRALVLWFPAPGSATGESVAELHLHGGRAVVKAALGALGAMPGLRLAEPGELTRRAFDNGKLDLAEVEGLADLIGAETEAQRRQALRQMDGRLSGLIGAWRERLLRALAHFEAAIDFPDEDLPDTLEAGVRGEISGLESEIARFLDDDRQGERLRDGLSVAIVGPPNAGKSSLLNALSKRDVAIVSALPGTTRDVLEVHLDLAGYPVTLSDTAGLRDLHDGDEQAVEAEGVRRAREQAARADLKLVVFDLQTWPNLDARGVALVDDASIVILNKSDLCVGPGPAEVEGRAALHLSARNGDGLDRLLDRLGEEVGARLARAAAAPMVTRLRHRTALEACRDALGRGGTAALPELAAEDLRLALRALGRITGRVDVEELLDVVFADFCIGK